MWPRPQLSKPKIKAPKGKAKTVRLAFCGLRTRAHIYITGSNK